MLIKSEAFFGYWRKTGFSESVSCLHVSVFNVSHHKQIICHGVLFLKSQIGLHLLQAPEIL